MDVGAEVGQKMRSAIKAKLLELNCYVDDELPDYIMVMVANKRSKSQMSEDLSLFLNTKTSTFVEWLHIVLKKLKEVTVTNPDVYKKVAKRKSTDQPQAKVKKEKKVDANVKVEKDSSESLTDDLPVSANQLSEQRKITILHAEMRNEDNVDEFDIPLLSEVNTSTEKDLEDIEKKIKNVKSRLGIMVDSELEVEIQKIKSEQDKLEKEQFQQTNVFEGTPPGQRIIELQEDDDSELSEVKRSTTPRIEAEPSLTPEKTRKYVPITYEEKSPPKRVSVLERLGKRPDDSESKQNRTNTLETRKNGTDKDNASRRNRNDKREADNRIRERKPAVKRKHSPEPKARDTENKMICGRLGVMSKIHVPQREPEVSEAEEDLRTRAVRSMVQVKPRVLPADAPQPSKNLLLKAVAEAHRSVAQAARVGNRQVKFERGVKRRLDEKSDSVPYTRKLSQSEKQKLRNLILAQVSSDSDLEDREYVPKPLKKVSSEAPKYVPSSRKSVDDSVAGGKEGDTQERVTLEGFEKRLGVIIEDQNDPEVGETWGLPEKRVSAKSRLEGRRSPSPIVFDAVVKKPPSQPTIQVVPIKNKERCKYWPNCRQNDNCEFVHPSRTCEAFPNCKFGDTCIYVHPGCKFGASCTKRGCPYSHSGGAAVASTLPVSKPAVCKFFPKCANISCPFYHPRMCRFGKFCNNMAECGFVHVVVGNKSNLTWRSK